MEKALKNLVLCAAALSSAGCVLMRDLPYRDRRKAADQAFENREYLLAAARYESLRDLYPGTRVREEMAFRQGVALYSATSYRDARQVFHEYMKEYPEGQFLADTRDYARKIDVLMSRSTPAEARKLAEAKDKANLDALVGLMTEHPTDWRVLEAIGDTHWKLGNYDDAVMYYHRAHGIASAYAERELNNGKLVLDADGKPVPVNPGILAEMEVGRRPVRVYGLHAYTARNQTNMLGGDIQFYNLAGSVRNQGKRLLRNVQVQVVYKDLGGNILDVDLVGIGALGPGDVRSFMSRARNYDNLYNIVSHEVDVHWRD